MKKILFNDKYGLTGAVLDGRKTMTRRIIKAPRTMDGKDVYGFCVVSYRNGEIAEVMAVDEEGAMINNILPKYKVGEVVAVAQSYEEICLSFIQPPDKQWGVTREMSGYHNKMFVRDDLMPHQIRITNVRVERLQDISDEDCMKEGIRKLESSDIPTHFTFDGWMFNNRVFRCADTPREAFSALFNKLSGKGAWDKNPWVFVYEFELLR